MGKKHREFFFSRVLPEATTTKIDSQTRVILWEGCAKTVIRLFSVLRKYGILITKQEGLGLL
jgi:hypothetical protein